MKKIKCNLTEKQLNEIGHEIASGWGGSFLEYSLELIENEPTVIFYCVEHGEYFTTTLSIEEILKEYKDCLK